MGTAISPFALSSSSKAILIKEAKADVATISTLKLGNDGIIYTPSFLASFTN